MSAPDETRPILLEGAHVLSLDDDVPHDAALLIADGVIAAIGTAAELRERHPDATRVPCRNRIVMPGLVNAHLHPDLHVLRGSVDALALHQWGEHGFFNDALELLGSPEGRAAQQASIRASLAEAALAGTTCIGAYGVTDGALEACADAMAELGLRGTVTARDETFTRHDGSVLRDGKDYRVFYRLHAEEALFAPELELARAAHERGQHIVMHAAETPLRCELARRNFGTTTVRLLARYGLLSPRVLLSHLTYVDDEEIALMAQHGACAVFSAAAEMKLGDGIPPALDVLAAGVPAALGTDAAVCSNGTDMFLEMRAFAWQQSLRYGAGRISPEQILHLATAGGAAVLGMDGATGRLAEGLAADLVLMDMRSPAFEPRAPWHPLPAALVFSATGAAVTDVMVGGRWIVRRRRLTMPGSAGIRRDLARAVRALHTHLKR